MQYILPARSGVVIKKSGKNTNNGCAEDGVHAIVDARMSTQCSKCACHVGGCELQQFGRPPTSVSCDADRAILSQLVLTTCCNAGYLRQCLGQI